MQSSIKYFKRNKIIEQREKKRMHRQRKTINIFFFILYLASALECWDCRSEFHSICTEYWDSSKLSSSDKVNRYGTCPSIGKSCMKAVVKNDGGKFFLEFSSNQK